jgi:polyhydroxyalkanoate synthase
MTTDKAKQGENGDQVSGALAENLKRVEDLSARLVQVMSRKRPSNPALEGPDQALFARAATTYWTEAMQNPAKVLEHQIDYWSQSVRHFVAAQQSLSAGGDAVLARENLPTDRRFSNPMWSTHPFFSYIRQQYVLNADAIRQAVNEAPDMSATERRQLTYFSSQIIDMMSPTNFLATNPDALVRAVETEGQSLVDGLENLVSDLEANNGELVVKLADETAFEIGGNVATAPGSVVFRNKMMELIQYAPSTEKVRKTPIVLFPPWINKFYILDLKEKNSLIRWITDQGFTLFVVSWINPTDDYSDIGLEDYIEAGYLAAIDVAKEICDVPSVNAVGYCIGGTTLALTLSLLEQRGDTSIKSATFFTALTDFSDQGEFTPFLQNDFIDGIEAEIDSQGLLPSYVMARTFSFLRANDLIYGPAIRSYMMGETPPAFDLLFWNGDGANLPGRMAMQYLRGLCQRNEFATSGFELLGHRLQLSDVNVPVCAVACETDHIAAWKDCYRGVGQMGSDDKTFIMTQSGHIAGIVNPPSKKKYGHYSNANNTLDAQAWLQGAQFHKGSWWPRWGAWLAKQSGRKSYAPPQPGGQSYQPLSAAPGAYVKCSAGQAPHL